MATISPAESKCPTIKEMFSLYNSIPYAREEKVNEMTIAFLKCGGTPNTPEEITGDTLLTKATLKNYTEVMKTLLEGGANPNALTGNYGNTAIFATYSVKAVSLLAKHGADLNHRNKFKQHPLEHACNITGLRAVDIFRQMVESGAKLSPETKSSCEQIIDRNCPSHMLPKDSPAQQQRVGLLKLIKDLK